MTVRRMYQLALLLGAASGILALLFGLMDIGKWALVLLAVALLALMAMVHLRTLIILQRSVNATAHAAGFQNSPRTGPSADIDDVLRAQAASESFIRGDLFELRQRINEVREMLGLEVKGDPQ